MADQKIINRVPTNIITGFLGVGKTTAIRNLLSSKPNDQHWAVLVNEFGEVGIDGNLFAENTDSQKWHNRKSGAWRMHVLFEWFTFSNGIERAAGQI